MGINNPIAIRYPRGRGSNLNWRNKFQQIEIGKGEMLTSGDQMAILTIGSIGERVKKIIAQFPEGEIAHFNMRFVKPLDEKLLYDIFVDFSKILTIEEGVLYGGFGSAILEFGNDHGFKDKIVKRLGIPDTFIEHGTIQQLFELVGLDDRSIKSNIDSLLKKQIK